MAISESAVRKVEFLATMARLDALRKFLGKQYPRAVPFVSPDGDNMLLCDGQFQRRNRSQAAKNEVHFLEAEPGSGQIVLRRHIAIFPDCAEVTEKDENGIPVTRRVARFDPEFNPLVADVIKKVRRYAPNDPSIQLSFKPKTEDKAC